MKRHGADQTEHDFLSQEFLMHEDTSSVGGTDSEQSHSNEETIENNECAFDAECTSRQEQIATESLRQRTNKQSPVVRYKLNMYEVQIVVSEIVHLIQFKLSNMTLPHKSTSHQFPKEISFLVGHYLASSCRFLWIRNS